MKRKIVWAVIVFLLALSCAGGTWADDAADLYPIMKPDRETRLRWIYDYETAPRAYIDRSPNFTFAPEGSLSLLSHLPYTPSQRNQGSCGNCWAWAGTGVMEIAHDVQESIFDRLSVQFISSCNTLKTCCEGGWLSDLATFYTSRTYTIPWTNTNASWQNGDGNCNVPCANISTSPSYGINSIEAQTIPTHGVGQATAIANIKNVLNQQKAVWFAFFMGTAEDWSSFRSFWNTQSESVVWDFDPTCGKPYTEEGGGHAVLCVGYNDDDPANSYWIMVNSWGAPAGRPNGIFRVAMDMNYDCAETTSGDKNLYWQTLGVTFNAGGQTVYVDHAGSCNGYSPCSSTIQGGIGLAADGATIKIAGGTYAEDVNLNVDKKLTFKGGYDTTYSSQTLQTVCRKLTLAKGSAVLDKVTLGDTPAPAGVASAVFFNDLVCSLTPFTATLTIDGEPLASVSGQYSNCEEVDCGVSVSWSLYADGGVCGIVSESGSLTLTCDCLYEIVLGLDEYYSPSLYVYTTCPGDCSNVTPAQVGSKQLLDCVRLSKDGESRGLESLGCFITK